MTVGKNGKPSIAILKEDYSVWLVNPSMNVMKVTASELFGFGTGSFADAVISHSMFVHSIFIFAKNSNG